MTAYQEMLARMGNNYVQLLNELESHRLEVMLVPLNPGLRGYCEGGMKRVVSDKPPRWYRDLCNRWPSSRGVRRAKFDTRIRRANILSVLSRLARGVGSCSKYAGELRAIARKVA